MSPNIIFQPSLTFQEILDRAEVISTDGTQWARLRGGWMITGIGFVAANIVQPFDESEMRGKMIDATDLAFLPDINSNDVVIVKGYERLKEQAK